MSSVADFAGDVFKKVKDVVQKALPYIAIAAAVYVTGGLAGAWSLPAWMGGTGVAAGATAGTVGAGATSMAASPLAASATTVGGGMTVGQGLAAAGGYGAGMGSSLAAAGGYGAAGAGAAGLSAGIPATLGGTAAGLAGAGVPGITAASVTPGMVTTPAAGMAAVAPSGAAQLASAAPAVGSGLATQAAAPVAAAAPAAAGTAAGGSGILASAGQFISKHPLLAYGGLMVGGNMLQGMFTPEPEDPYEVWKKKEEYERQHGNYYGYDYSGNTEGGMRYIPGIKPKDERPEVVHPTANWGYQRPIINYPRKQLRNA